MKRSMSVGVYCDASISNILSLVATDTQASNKLEALLKIHSLLDRVILEQHEQCRIELDLEFDELDV